MSDKSIECRCFSTSISIPGRSKLGREEIKWQELLLHFRQVQVKHEKAKAEAVVRLTAEADGLKSELSETQKKWDSCKEDLQATRDANGAAIGKLEATLEACTTDLSQLKSEKLTICKQLAAREKALNELASQTLQEKASLEGSLASVSNI